MEIKSTNRTASVGILKKAGNALKAFGRAAKNGFKTADKREIDIRRNICTTCEKWNPSGNLGFGECLHKKCGCTKFKIHLASESCPLGKWKAVI